VIAADDLTLGRGGGGAPEKDRKLFSLPAKGVRFEDLEKDIVTQALDRTGWNQTRAGELLGMTRDQIHYRMEKFGLLKGESPGERR
jgi:transcriptional regulator with GAF, ATPase, and Fis domain